MTNSVVTATSEANAAPEPDGAELIVELTPQSYELVLLTAQRAGTRGMADGFDKWLVKCIETGFRTINRVWDTADVNKRNKAEHDHNESIKVLITAALDGSKTAQAKLRSMGVDVIKEATK